MKTAIKTFIVIAIVGIGYLAWYLGSPLFIDNTVDEEFPISDTFIEETKRMPKETSLVLRRGQFEDADSFHKGSGTATVYERPDSDEKLLRFEDFSVTNGPALSVYLTKENGVLGDNAIDLGKLKGNVGNQNYTVPGDIDLDAYSSVLIYCVPFDVVFAFAPLK